MSMRLKISHVVSLTDEQIDVILEKEGLDVAEMGSDDEDLERVIETYVADHASEFPDPGSTTVEVQI